MDETLGSVPPFCFLIHSTDCGHPRGIRDDPELSPQVAHSRSPGMQSKTDNTGQMYMVGKLRKQFYQGGECRKAFQRRGCLECWAGRATWREKVVQQSWGREIEAMTVGVCGEARVYEFASLGAGGQLPTCS